MSSGSLFTLVGIVLAAIALDAFILWQWRRRIKTRLSKTLPPPSPQYAIIKVQTVGRVTSRESLPRVVTLNPVREAYRSASGMGGALPAWLAPRPVWLNQLHLFAHADVILFACVLIFYLVTRFYGITDYPIYFHSDEAIHSVLASELIRDNGWYEEKTFLPTYFKNGGKFNLSLSVYAQVVPVWWFGKSVAIARGTSALLSLIPAIVVGVIVRDFLKLPYWWSATLLLGIAPAWFLHSRTAFETVMSVSLYAGFLYFYLRYRLNEPKHLYTALVFGALMFYAYSPAQLVIVICALILLIADFRYHLKHWKIGVGGAILLLFLALPYLRFRLSVPQAIEEHLRDLGSYWLTQAPLSEKLAQFWREYTYGLSPGYWYISNGNDLPRHQMGQHGHLLSITLPFALAGVFVAVRKLIFPKSLNYFGQQLTANAEETPRSARSDMVGLTYRTLLIVLLIAPLPGTLAQVGITRVLTFILPITILTTIGMIVTLRWLEKWFPVWVLAATVFAALSVGTIFLARDAFTNGMFWHRNYGLGGMQYGAKQVFDEIQNYLDTNRAITIVMSPDWANGSDVLSRFFLPGPKNIEFGSASSYLYQIRPLTPAHLLVFTPAEYQDIIQSGKFKNVVVEKTILWPDGQPGFYFLRMQYADNIDEILAQESETHRALQAATVRFNGMTIPVQHSILDMGTIEQAFDGRDDTLIRTNQVNPFVVELVFPEVRTFRSISVNVGASNVRLKVSLYPTAGGEPVVVSEEAQGLLEAPVIVMDFGQAVDARIIRVEVFMLEQGERAYVHIWEIRLR